MSKTKSVRLRRSPKMTPCRRNPAINSVPQGRSTHHEAAASDHHVSASYLRDELTRDRYLELSFMAPSGQRETRRIPAEKVSEKTVGLELRAQGALLDQGTSSAAIIQRAENALEVILTERTGFRGVDAFVLPERMLGAAKGRFRWKKSPEDPQVGLAGRHKRFLTDWNSSVGKLCSRSTYLSFAVCEALAAPLPGYAAALSEAGGDHKPMAAETATFNLSGESGTGRTECARVASSVVGHPDGFSSWNFTPRGLVEDLAQHNDVLLVLDDFEKCIGPTSKRRTDLCAATQAIPEGQPKSIAQIAKDGGLPAHRWSTFALSSSPKPLPQIAAELGHTMSQGEIARAIDIPVPNRASGGIFDRLKAQGWRRQLAAHRSARRLKSGLAATYGTLFPAWIAYLQEADRTKELLRYRDEFVQEVCPAGDSWDRRVAEKFGILMAAGRVAVDAGLLEWPQHWPMRIMKTAYARHKDNSGTPADSAKALVRKIANDFNNPRLYLSVDTKAEAHFGTETMGLRYSYRDEDVIAVRDDMLTKLTGTVDTRRAFDALLSELRLVRGGQGDRNTTQIKRACWIDGERCVKRRYLLISVEALERWR